MSKIFGKNPSGSRLQQIILSPNYKNGSFQNLSPTPVIVENASHLKIMRDFIHKPKDAIPPRPLPSLKTNLKASRAEKPMITWFGHSSYLIQINGKNILVDPVFSGNASPFSFSIKAFPGTNLYTEEDMPEIDLLIQTHDHYDHLDYKTIMRLQPKIKMVCTSLGVGSHFAYWGWNENKILEFDWWEKRQLGDMELTALPARHFSGRSLRRGKTLWSAFVLRTNESCIFIGGDSGYDEHFKTIGDKFGPMDIAMLECGQYNPAWAHIHMMPEETAQASIDLKSKLLLPVHWGKFSLALHPWDEPIRRLIAKANELGVRVTTPLIGEPVIPGEIYPEKNWWLDI